MESHEFFDLLPYPAWIFDRVPVGNDNKRPGAAQSRHQGFVKLLTGCGLVFAEEDCEIAFSQTACQVRGVAAGAPGRRTKRE
jgi:hypothetical protein